MAYESELALGLVPYTAGEQPKGIQRLIKLNTNETHTRFPRWRRRWQTR